MRHTLKSNHEPKPTGTAHVNRKYLIDHTLLFIEIRVSPDQRLSADGAHEQRHSRRTRWL